MTLATVSIIRIPSCFLSLATSLNTKTVISKVSIPVWIWRLKISESRFQSRYQDSNFKTLDSSLNIKTQLSKVSILVSMFRLNSWISNLCPNFKTGSAKQKLLENATPPICKILLIGKMALTFVLMLQFDAQKDVESPLIYWLFILLDLNHHL